MSHSQLFCPTSTSPALASLPCLPQLRQLQLQIKAEEDYLRDHQRRTIKAKAERDLEGRLATFAARNTAKDEYAARRKQVGGAEFPLRLYDSIMVGQQEAHITGQNKHSPPAHAPQLYSQSSIRRSWSTCVRFARTSFASASTTSLHR